MVDCGLGENPINSNPLIAQKNGVTNGLAQPLVTHVFGLIPDVFREEGLHFSRKGDPWYGVRWEFIIVIEYVNKE